MSVSDKDVAAVEALVSHEFSDRALCVRALTHPSAVGGRANAASYERLEFLGDSILGAIVAYQLFTTYPDMTEGELTRMKVSLISGETLSKVAAELGLGEHIDFGSSEKNDSRGLHSALENVYEALVGALYLDAGYAPTKAFVTRSLAPHVSREIAFVPDSPKSLLQEITQREARLTPTYRMVSQTGPSHNPTFSSVVYLDGIRIGRGTGSSKKESESNAALNAIERIRAGEVEGVHDQASAHDA